MLTEKAKVVISTASLIYGSPRAIETARTYITGECEVHEIKDYRNLDKLPPDTVILSTGDPMLAGLGYLPGEVIPGISSLQTAAARLRVPLARVSVVLAHGRDHKEAVEETFEELSRNKVVFLVPDPQFNVSELAAGLHARFPEATVAVCEDLGYPEENIILGTPDNPPRPRSGLFSLMIGTF